ncbi:MAG TPA: BadF/BadG/BcrA/BcrD ATPase family protein [Granulicella sp.]|jgi:glucosamine kinase|nr:BadF/BadG/BcrA/BcrD ATPase family protein [Granulicella sp.]
MAYFLALDAGGTKTDFVLADETRELARVRTGTIKRLRTDAASATLHLEAALAELTERTGVSMQAITRTCVGTAGETVALVTDWLREAIGCRVSGELVVLGDVEIALDAAFFGRAGVLAMAGTGSNVAGRTEQGVLVRAGGWGPALSDQGSGHRIGQEALRAGFLAKDEGRSTVLLDAVLEFWELASLDLLIEVANRQPAPDFSRLTELVLGCAERGDAVAAAVLKKEGEELGYLVRLVLRRLQTASSALQELPAIAFTGSIMDKVLPVREALIAAVREEFPRVQVKGGVIDPIAGAVWRARGGVRS